ncbi:UDP-glucose 4-epimerase GalE [Streptomyces sp. NPDC048255]|uniref:UDP-glucose 4-epimerase GalE n=1 Tax=Streptomyces sp. NPDC048255 TaxID=3154713 RepID=UPI0033D67DDA
MKVLIAGGAGFIGSTIASACIDSGITPVILDNLATGRREFTQGRTFYEGDICDGDLVDRIFTDHPDIDTAIDCAALIVVPDSVANPLGYYRENVSKGIQFLEHLTRNNCRNLLFSSSASIYQADPEDFSVDENSPLETLSPYARTKALFETILRDVAEAGTLNVISLRYFNPIGADTQLRTGLQIRTPTHALGKMIDVHHAGAVFPLTGTDYLTRDGSGIRDYVHVWDLAAAHIRAVQNFAAVTQDGPYRVINLGTGRGTTVRELVTAFENVTGTPLATTETERRPGDSAGAYARVDLAQDLLGWKAELSLEDGIRDSLRWYAKRDTALGTTD